jgi:plasmid stabilization system protein ParE
LIHKALILPLATKDIQETAKWYNSRQYGVGRKFTNQVRRSIHFIRGNPEAIAIRYDSIRTALVDTFPYMIHYFIEESSSSIIIVAVLHTSQDPRLWKRTDS